MVGLMVGLQNIQLKNKISIAEEKILEAPTGGHGATCRSCAHCPWMAMNNLAKLKS